MSEINWPVSFRAHFIAGELDAEPSPVIAELVVSFDEQGKSQFAWPADRTKTMLPIRCGGAVANLLHSPRKSAEFRRGFRDWLNDVSFRRG